MTQCLGEISLLAGPGNWEGALAGFPKQRNERMEAKLSDIFEMSDTVYIDYQ